MNQLVKIVHGEGDDRVLAFVGSPPAARMWWWQQMKEFGLRVETITTEEKEMVIR